MIHRRDFLKLASTLPTALALPPSVLKLTDEQTAPPNILIFIFDAWSAHNISLCGYPRKTTPNIDRLAEKAIVYHNHYSSACYTYPSTSSLLTGVLPWTHWGYWNTPKQEIEEDFYTTNIFSLFETHYRFAYTNNPLANNLLKGMAANLETYLPAIKLALPNIHWFHLLFDNDPDISVVSWSRTFETAETGAGNSAFLSRIYSHLRAKRLEEYLARFPRGIPSLSAMDHFILETPIDWTVASLKTSPNPYLGYVHLLPPHSPYNTRSDFIDVFRDDDYKPIEKARHPMGRSDQPFGTQIEDRRKYDEYILYADAEFNRFMEQMEASGVLENTIVILTSDHGEMFERGIPEHLYPSFHDPLLHIPLMIFMPGQDKRVDIHELTTTVDLLPTLLQLSGKPLPGWLEGAVLPPFSPQVQADRSIFSVDFRYVPKFTPLRNGSIMLRKGTHKLSLLFGKYKRYDDLEDGKLIELYDLENDPDELVNLYHPQSELGVSMRDEILAKIDQIGLELPIEV